MSSEPTVHMHDDGAAALTFDTCGRATYLDLNIFQDQIPPGIKQGCHLTCVRQTNHICLITIKSASNGSCSWREPSSGRKHGPGGRLMAAASDATP